jgi:hypothetical protein
MQRTPIRDHIHHTLSRPERATAGLAAAAVVLLLAGCGGQGRLSRADYVRKADSICQRYNDAVARLTEPSDLQGLVQYTRRTLAELDRALADESRLKPPRRLEPRKRRWLAQAQRIRGDTAAVLAAARHGDAVDVRRLILRGTRDDARGNALARRLGLRVCSKP